MAELLHLDLSTEPEGTGKNEYLAACEALGIVPVAMFIAKLDCAHINLRHHGVGVKGARALAAALKPNTHIRALNLGDNWLGDEGAAAVAAVLGVNATIASLNLAENRIGAYGVRALSDGIKRTSVLRELVLKGNGLDDRAAAPLVEAITKSNSLSRLDLSSNAFGEEMGVLLGAAIASHGYLLELNLGWNSLRGKGGTGIAEGLKSNLVLQKINLSWNGMGDSVASALGHALATNSTLIEIDASHNRFGCAGAIAIAEGLKSNHSLITCELSHNPMAVDEAMRISLDGVTAIVEALRENTSIETLGLSHVQEAAAHKRGDAPRFDPKRPDGHYRLDLSQPWDSFICETLYDRMTAESGESWMNMKLNGAALVLPRDGSQWHPPTEGVIDFDYVTWKHGMEVHSENLRKQRTARAVRAHLAIALAGRARFTTPSSHIFLTYLQQSRILCRSSGDRMSAYLVVVGDVGPRLGESWRRNHRRPGVLARLPVSADRGSAVLAAPSGRGPGTAPCRCSPRAINISWPNNLKSPRDVRGIILTSADRPCRLLLASGTLLEGTRSQRSSFAIAGSTALHSTEMTGNMAVNCRAPPRSNSRTCATSRRICSNSRWAAARCGVYQTDLHTRISACRNPRVKVEGEAGVRVAILQAANLNMPNRSTFHRGAF